MERTIEESFRRWRDTRDPDALAAVFDATAPRLLRLAVHLVGDASAAEDLVQATFVTAIDAADTFDARRPLEPWLAGILTNAARALRREARREPDLARIVEREQATPLEEASARELSGALARALDELPEPYRETLLLRVRHGMKAADIAHLLGTSSGAVRVRIHRGLELLRKRLPAGIALGALLVLEPERGLAALRESVLSRAANLPRIAQAKSVPKTRAPFSAPHLMPALKTLGGLLMAKKIGLVIAALAVAWLVWLGFAARPGWSSQPADVHETAAELERPKTTSLVAGQEPAVRMPEPVVAGQVSIELSSVLRGRVLDGESGTPIVGAKVALHAPRKTRLFDLLARWPGRVAQHGNGGPRVADSSWPWVREPLDDDALLDQAEFEVYEPPPEGIEPLSRAVSGPEGEFELAAPKEWGFLLCEAEGYASRGLPAKRRQTLRFTDQSGVSQQRTLEFEDLDVQLFRTWKLAGYLIDVQGARLARSLRLDFMGWAKGHVGEPTTKRLSAIGAEFGFPKAGAESLGPEMIDRWSTRTSADGTFEIEVAAPHVQPCGAEAGWLATNQGLHPVRRERYVFISSWTPASTEPAVVVLRESRELPVLVVRDAATGAPVERFSLIILGRGQYPSRSGVFHAPRGRLELFEPGFLQDASQHEQLASRHCLTVWSDHHLPKRIEVDDLARAGEITVALDRGSVPTLAGSVTLAGKPAAGARVSLLAFSRMQWDEDEKFVVATTRTDASGAFSLSAPEGEYLARCTLADRKLVRVVQVPASTPLGIELDSVASIVVRVRSSDGTPRVGHRLLVKSSEGGQRAGDTDERGEASFAGLVEGKYKVHVPHELAKFSFSGGEVVEVQLAAGEQRTVDVVIPAADPRYARLVPSRTVDLSGWRARANAYDENGWVAIEPAGRIPIDVQVGIPTLQIESGERRRWTVAIPNDPPDGFAVRVELDGLGYSGVLLDAKGEPCKNVWVVATSGERDDRTSVSARTDAAGRFEIVGLEPRAHELSFQAERDDSRRRDPLGNVALELSAEPANPPRPLSIRLPTIDPETREIVPSLEVVGRARVAGGDASGLRLILLALQEVDGGVLRMSRKGSWTDLDPEGRFRALVPAAQKLRASFYDPRTERAWPRLEWSRPAGPGPEEHDFDL